MNYYNEFDKGAAAWLRELISEGLIPDGTVDERDIRDVQPADIVGFTQCHFFAGIAGWPLALQLAGWPADRPVWTGSCPCQPFSAAGKRKGTQDARHLWPDWFRLIRECRPDAVMGEQVEGAIRLGWLDGVFADLEGEAYSCRAVVFGSHSVGAPHIRQRLYWVADAGPTFGERRESEFGPACQDSSEWNTKATDHQRGGPTGRLAESDRIGIRLSGHTKAGGASPGVQGADGQRERLRADARTGGATECGRLGDSGGEGLERRPGERGDDGAERQATERAGSPWSDFDLIPCRDGKTRRVPAGSQSVLQCLADGLSDDVDGGRRAGFPLCQAFQGRNGLLKGYGNAINVYAAAEFIRATRSE